MMGVMFAIANEFMVLIRAPAAPAESPDNYKSQITRPEPSSSSLQLIPIYNTLCGRQCDPLAQKWLGSWQSCQSSNGRVSSCGAFVSLWHGAAA